MEPHEEEPKDVEAMVLESTVKENAVAGRWQKFFVPISKRYQAKNVLRRV